MLSIKELMLELCWRNDFDILTARRANVVSKRKSTLTTHYKRLDKWSWSFSHWWPTYSAVTDVVRSQDEKGHRRGWLDGTAPPTGYEFDGQSHSFGEWAEGASACCTAGQIKSQTLIEKNHPNWELNWKTESRDYMYCNFGTAGNHRSFHQISGGQVS